MEDPIPDEATAEPNAQSREDSTMSTTTLELPMTVPLSPPAADPFFYGWRYVTRWQNGSPKSERIPLTEWDVLHPQEEDFIVHNDAHDQNSIYLKIALLQHFEGRADVKVLHDHRVDWQVQGIIPHGPDVSVFDGLSKPWDPDLGTFMVKQMKARPLVAIEVTSPSTRNKDLSVKVTEYFQSGVPFYLIVDRMDDEEKPYVRLLAYRTTPEGFVLIDEDPQKGVWIPTVRLWFKGEGEWIACYTEDGTKLLDPVALAKQNRENKEVAARAIERATQEIERAEQERIRADQAVALAESQRAELETLRQKLREAEERTK